MSYYSDPTANAAIGSVDKEIKRLRKKAKRIYELRQSGKLEPWKEKLLQKEFVGIFAHILEEDFSEDEETEAS